MNSTPCKGSSQPKIRTQVSFSEVVISAEPQGESPEHWVSSLSSSGLPSRNRTGPPALWADSFSCELSGKAHKECKYLITLTLSHPGLVPAAWFPLDPLVLNVLYMKHTFKVWELRWRISRSWCGKPHKIRQNWKTAEKQSVNLCHWESETKPSVWFRKIMMIKTHFSTLSKAGFYIINLQIGKVFVTKVCFPRRKLHQGSLAWGIRSWENVCLSASLWYNLPLLGNCENEPENQLHINMLKLFTEEVSCRHLKNGLGKSGDVVVIWKKAGFVQNGLFETITTQTMLSSQLISFSSFSQCPVGYTHRPGVCVSWCLCEGTDATALFMEFLTRVYKKIWNAHLGDEGNVIWTLLWKALHL